MKLNLSASDFLEICLKMRNGENDDSGHDYLSDICFTFYYERSTKKIEVIYAIYERKDGIEFLKPFQGGLAYNV